MKHKINLLLLLSVAGSIECASGASGKGQRRTSASTDPLQSQLVGQHPIAEQPMARQEITFGTHAPVTVTYATKMQSPATTRITKRQFASWSPVDTTLPKTGSVNKIIASYADKNSHKLVRYALGKGSYATAHTTQDLVADHQNHFKHALTVVPALTELYTAALKKRDAYTQSADGDTTVLRYITQTLPNGTKSWAEKNQGLLAQVIKEIEKTGNFPSQNQSTMNPTDSAHNFEVQMLEVVNNSGWQLPEQQRRIGALLIEQERNHLHTELPYELQLSTFFTVKSYATQLQERIAALHGKNLTAKETTIRSTLEQMLQLQTLRDAQLAFSKGGSVVNLRLALLAPKKARCQTAITALEQLLKTTKNPDNLNVIKGIYSERLHTIEALENSARGLPVIAVEQTAAAADTNSTTEANA